jgi:hypothetical protein
MAKQDNVKDKHKPAGEGAAGKAASITDGMPRMALASLERAGNETPKSEPSPIGTTPAETTAIAAPKIELSSIEAPQLAPEIVEPKLFPSENAPGLGESAPGQEEIAAGSAADNPPPPSHVNRFTMLAACLALAAAFGGMVGALAAYGFVRPAPTPVIAGKFGSEEIHALKENVVQARVELAALKATVDASNRVATTQLTKIAERIERSERNAAEPAAKINKAVESLERIARNESAASPKDVTGSITPPQPAAGKPAAVEGWVLRDVHRGTAFIEGRAGVIEVEQGDLVPGLGRIEAVRKQEGRWVVVTSKGTITAPR